MKLQIEDITAVIDTREQKPWNLAPMRTIGKKLTTGDYSIEGLENFIAIERKSLPDLLQSIGQSRDRFDDCIGRMLQIPSKCIIVESTWDYFLEHRWKWISKLHLNSAVASVMGWMEMGIPIVFAGTPQQASLCACRFLFLAAKRRHQERETRLEEMDRDRMNGMRQTFENTPFTDHKLGA